MTRTGSSAGMLQRPRRRSLRVRVEEVGTVLGSSAPPPVAGLGLETVASAAVVVVRSSQVPLRPASTPSIPSDPYYADITVVDSSDGEPTGISAPPPSEVADDAPEGFRAEGALLGSLPKDAAPNETAPVAEAAAPAARQDDGDVAVEVDEGDEVDEESPTLETRRPSEPSAAARASDLAAAPAAPPTAHSPRPQPPAPPPAPPRKEPAPPVVDEGTASGKQAWFETIFGDDYLRTVRPLPAHSVRYQCDFIAKELGLAPGARVLDVGCGTGQHAAELARCGYAVTGLDLSQELLRIAEQQQADEGQRPTFVRGDMRGLPVEGEFDAVLCWGTTFGYFDDDTNRKVMDQFHRVLRPGGMLLVEAVNRDYVMVDQPRLVWFEGDRCICIEETGFNSITSRLLVKRTVIKDDGHQFEHFYSVRLYSLHEMGQLMHHRGFKVTRVSGYEAAPGAFFGADSPRMIVTAERRAGKAALTVPARDSGRPTAQDLPPVPSRMTVPHAGPSSDGGNRDR